MRLVSWSIGECPDATWLDRGRHPSRVRQVVLATTKRLAYRRKERIFWLQTRNPSVAWGLRKTLTCGYILIDPTAIGLVVLIVSR